MGNRSIIITGTIIFILLSAMSFADDSCWRTCQAEVEALCRKGKWGQALQRGKSALKLARAKNGPSHLNTAKSLEKLGHICRARGKVQDTNVFVDRALTIRSKIHCDCHPSVIRLLTMKADNFRVHRQYDRAEGLYRQALHLADKGGWSESSYAAPSLEGLARLHSDRREYASAEPLYQKAIAIYGTGGKYRPTEKLSEARCLTSLADIKRAKGDFREARQLYEAAVEKYSAVSGPGSPMIAFIYKRLAELHVDRGVPSLALSYFQRALGAYDRTGLPEGPLTAATLVGMANLLKSQGKPARAKDLYSSADTIYERTGGLDRELATMVLSKEKIWPVR